MNQLTFHSQKYNNTFQTKRKKFLLQALNLLISDNIRGIKLLENEETKQHNNIKNQIHENDLNNFYETHNQKWKLLDQRLKNKLQRKFNAINSSEQQNQLQVDTTNWITNLTDRLIPTEVEEVLCLGPKFSLPYQKEKLPVYDIIASIETAINGKNEFEKNEIRTIVTKAIINEKNKPIRKDRTNELLEQKIKKTKRYLNNNKEILVTTADKSKQTVIMEKSEYNRKMENLLNDTSTYKPIKKDPTAIFQKKTNTLIQQWADELTISLKTASELKGNNALPPKIYGMPKLHKKDIPLRPVVSCVQSPTYKLEKYLSNILKNVVGQTKNTVINSWEFVEQIKNFSVPNNFEMCSLDVISMYTSIPKTLVMEVVNKRWKDIKNHTNIPKDQFLEAIKLCLYSSYFKYNECVYEQTNGLPMGAPLSAMVANMVLEDLENAALETLPVAPALYKRYVDDIFTIVHTNERSNILGKFNNYNPKIQFTLENEKDRTMNFLDVHIERNNNTLKTKWHTKPTWSGRYLNFQAHAPIKYKRNTVTNIAKRAINFTNPEHRKDQIAKIQETMKRNGYPETFTKKIIQQQVHRAYNQRQTDTKREEENVKYVGIPYIQGTTEKLAKLLRPYKLKIAAKTDNNLQQMYTKLKTKTEINKCTHVVYKVQCENCNGSYIGQTRQYLGSRIKAHENSVKNKNTDKTALKKHHEDHGHTFDFKNVKILKKEPLEKKRIIYESLYIKKDPTSINDRKDIENISVIYNSALK